MTYLRVATALGLALVTGLHCPAALTQPREMHWYRGNTHAHTVNSDGDSSPNVVASWYKENGYQFLFITDHDFLTDSKPLNELLAADERFLLLPGEEITQWGPDHNRSAHINALFISRVIEPYGRRRCSGTYCGAHAPAEDQLSDVIRAHIDAIVAQGGIAQIDHPNYRWAMVPHDLVRVPDFTLMEVWNGNEINNLGGDDGTGDVRPSTEGFWDTLLSAGKIVWGVGSDDAHNFGAAWDYGRRQGARSWIMVRASELSRDSVYGAIRNGEFYASNGVQLGSIKANATSLSLDILEKNEDEPRRYKTRFIGKDGQVLKEMAGLQARYEFRGTETYVRAVVTDSNGKTAWSQPVFLDKRNDQSPYRVRGSKCTIPVSYLACAE